VSAAISVMHPVTAITRCADEDPMIEMNQLKALVIVPTLERMDEAFRGASNPAAADCLCGIAAHESTIGGVTYLKQVNGPALGIYQIEPATHEDLSYNYLYYQDDKDSLIAELVPIADMNRSDRTHAQLTYDLRYQTAVARAILYRASFAGWPGRDEMSQDHYVAALAVIWKNHWNTHLGAGTEQQYIDAFPREIL